MVARNRPAHFWLSRPRLHLAGARPSAAIYGRRRFGQTGAAVAKELWLGLGDESAQNRGGDRALGWNLERPLRRMRKILVTIIQVAVTIVLLWWVFHDHDQREKMSKALHQADYRWVIAAICAYVAVEVAAAVRWQILLRVQGIRLNFFRLSGLFLIGMFYNQFLPGGTGGDIIKSYLLLKETAEHKAGALLAVVFDRLIGLVALVTITVTLVTMRFDLLWRTPVTVESGFTPHQLLVALGLLLGVSITGLLVSFIVTGFNLFHLLPHRFPGRDKLIEISAAYHLYA